MPGGPLITKEDVADTDSSFSMAPSSQAFGISCSNNQFTDCSNVKLGEERGNAAKAAKSRIISRLILTITDFNRRLVGTHGTMASIYRETYGNGEDRMNIRKAIIPAAGLGTRFLPATKAMPKEMLPIVDKPTIQYIIEEAVASGIEDIIIVTGKGSGRLRTILIPPLSWNII